MTAADPDEGPVPVPADPVRRVLVELAADVLGRMPEADVPGSLRRIRAFTPVRRARAGAVPIALALERDAEFRAHVADAWRASHPRSPDGDEEPPAAADVFSAAAEAYLVRYEGWRNALEASMAELAAVRARSHGADLEASLRADMEAAEAEATRWRLLADAQARTLTELEQSVARLERDARRLRADADRARAEARGAALAAAQEEAGSAAVIAEYQAALRQAEDRAGQASDEAAAVRRSRRDAKESASLRARLLLDTIVDAAAGLRRELALPPADLAPADRVAASLGAGRDPTDVRADTPRALAVDDPAVLDGLIRLPRAHLIVDGYNVTKAGYGSLPLVDQRRRLVDGLVTLAARTGSEITCCFDGADVDGRGASRVRGVRVLFSEPGTTADELIRRLVHVEPAGRVVVVVSSDQEVAAGVVSAGGRAVPSMALLRLLARA